MKSGWELKKLGEVCEIKPPKKIAKEKLSESDLVTFFPMKDLKEFNHYIKPIKTKYLKDVYSGYVYFENNDVLMAKITPCFENGKLGIAKDLKNGIGFGSSEYMVFRPKVGILSEYVYYFLSLENIRRKGKNRMTGAVGHKRIPVDYLSNQNLIIPPLPEQKRIIAILDKAFAAIAKAKDNAEQNLKNAKELFESYLQSVKAEKKPLGNFVDIKTGKLNANAAVENGKYPFFTCSREIFAIDNYAFDLEAILLAGNNASGDFNVKHYKGKFNAYQRTYVITVNKENKVLYRYLYFQLLNSLKEFKINSVGANTRFLKLGMIKDMQIALPSITEQQTIVKKLDALSTETKKLEAIYQQKIDNLEELKKSVLQKAFSGQLKQSEA
jgi:type I restriction enzyme S subunit